MIGQEASVGCIYQSNHSSDCVYYVAIYCVLKSSECFLSRPPSPTPCRCRGSLSVLVSHLLPVLLTCLSLLLSLSSPFSTCVCVCVASGKEYVTVGQLNQMYGMPKVESSPTSPLRQPLQSGAVDPAFSCLPSPHGSSLSLSVEVCAVLPRSSAKHLCACSCFRL